jgi:hypothetical protein
MTILPVEQNVGQALKVTSQKTFLEAWGVDRGQLMTNHESGENSLKDAEINWIKNKKMKGDWWSEEY